MSTCHLDSHFEYSCKERSSEWYMSWGDGSSSLSRVVKLFIVGVHLHWSMRLHIDLSTGYSRGLGLVVFQFSGLRIKDAQHINDQDKEQRAHIDFFYSKLYILYTSPKVYLFFPKCIIFCGSVLNILFNRCLY